MEVSTIALKLRMGGAATATAGGTSRLGELDLLLNDFLPLYVRARATEEHPVRPKDELLRIVCYLCVFNCCENFR